jgi:hypothetical protein
MSDIYTKFIDTYKEKLPFHIDKHLSEEEMNEAYEINKGKQKRHICIVRDGQEIRDLCNFRMKELNITTGDIEEITGVSKNTLTNFLFSRKRYSIPQKTVLVIADLLGINLNIQWEINPYYTSEEAKNRVKEVLKKQKRGG